MAASTVEASIIKASTGRRVARVLEGDREVDARHDRKVDVWRGAKYGCWRGTMLDYQQGSKNKSKWPKVELPTPQPITFSSRT